ncbi:MFS general substrate transporter [Thozetella sp. PMI_491]|nr:MFS general substrate transporter [Thozetella sp. PMI_491]
MSVHAPNDDLPFEEKQGISHVEALRREQTLQLDIDPKTDKRINRKIDIHIIPFLFGIWLFSFIDRTNIGNAKIEGMPADLGVATGNGFSIAITVFFITYILVDLPSNWLVKHIKAGRYLSALITCWGLTTTFLGFTKSLAGLIVARLFLGAFEGCLLGGILVYLAFFYRRHEIVTRIGIFYAAAPLSGAFGGLLALGLARIHYNGYNGWPWIFFSDSCLLLTAREPVQGILTTLFGISCFFALPHTPADAWFLTPEEKKLAMQRMKADAHGAVVEEDVNNEKFNWGLVKVALLAPQTWFCATTWFFLLIPMYSLLLFLPTIIQGMGYQTTTAQLYTVGPNMVAFIFVLVLTKVSDKIKARGPPMAAGVVLAIIGYAMVIGGKGTVRYGGTYFIAAGLFPASSMQGWLPNNLAPHYVRATGIGFVIGFSNLAAFISTFIYTADFAPDYLPGHYTCLGSLVMVLILITLQVTYLKRENMKRERGDRDYRLTEGNIASLGHRHPAFKYTI